MTSIRTLVYRSNGGKKTWKKCEPDWTEFGHLMRIYALMQLCIGCFCCCCGYSSGPKPWENKRTNKQTNKKTTHRTEILVCRVFVWFGLVLFFVCFFLPRLPSFVVASGKRGGVSGRVRLKMAPEGKRTWQRGSCRRPSLITGRFVVVSLSLSLSLSLSHGWCCSFLGKRKPKLAQPSPCGLTGFYRVPHWRSSVSCKSTSSSSIWDLFDFSFLFFWSSYGQATR